MLPAYAHEVIDAELEGIRSCAERLIVDVAETDVPAHRWRRSRQELSEGVARTLYERLEAAMVPLIRPSACGASAAFVHVSVHVRFLDPDRYIGFGERTYSYALSLAVDRRVLPQANGEPPQNGQRIFYTSASDLVDEGEGMPFERAIVNSMSHLGDELVAAWMQDNWRVPTAAVIAGTALTAALVVVALRGLARRRRPTD